MIPLRKLILRVLAFLARKVEGNRIPGATRSIYYTKDRVFTSDDFSEIPRCTWALTFEKPVDIRDIVTALNGADIIRPDLDLPLVQYQHILGKT